MSAEQPMQPIAADQHGVMRFRENAIVVHLLDHGGIDMNALAMLPFDDADRRQFAQLIGYSVSGYGDLSYAQGHESVAQADAIAGLYRGKPMSQNDTPDERPRDHSGRFKSRACPVCDCGTLQIDRRGPYRIEWACDGLIDPENASLPLQACVYTHTDGERDGL